MLKFFLSTGKSSVSLGGSIKLPVLFDPPKIDCKPVIDLKPTVGIDDIVSLVKKVISVKIDLILDKIDKDKPNPDCGCDCDDKFVIDDQTTVTRGTDGNDEVRLGAGNQTYYGGAGNDTIAGGPGNDQLSGGAGNDNISGDRDNDIICGGSGDDLLLGNAGNDKVYGGIGNDTLFGGRDDDLLEGCDGNDRLQGDFGNDTMSGGKGADVFVFMTGDGVDRITDFTTGSSGRDRIDVSALGPQFDTFAEVRAATTQTSNGALIDFGGGNSVLLEGVQASALTADHFLFA